MKTLKLILAATTILSASCVGAEDLAARPSLNLYGISGLIDMPTAEMQSDGVLNVSLGKFAGISHTTLTFQISPRLSGSFRYSGMQGYNPTFPTTNYDRSFDLRYQLIKEGRLMPAVLVGIQDFIGTDLYGAEYVVATKGIGPAIKLTAGLGWGRLGSYRSIGSLFGARPVPNHGLGGKPSFSQAFRGPAAPFGGIEWQANNRLRFKAEYSSDAYVAETKSRHLFNRKIPWNVGAEYDVNDSIRLGLYELYGTSVGFSLQVTLDPKVRPTGGVLGPGPTSVLVRPSVKSDPGAWSTDWASDPSSTVTFRDRMAKLLSAQGLTLEALSVTPGTAQLRVQNSTYDSAAQAIGRAARIMTQVLPASVETFQIVPVANGIPAAMVTIKRSDLEQLEFAPNGDKTLRERAVVTDAGRLPAGAVRGANLYPHLKWSLGPYINPSFFDPDNPLRADVGLRLSGALDVAPGVIVAGSITKKAFGNLNQSTRASNSVLQHVRSDANIYAKHNDPAIETLTTAWYSRPAPNLYGRVTVGYLEPMYGGISTELLWQRPNSPFALGAELDYVRQRSFDEMLSFQHYKVATGFVSAYYQFKSGYAGRLDVGRYLAGDRGATLTLAREFSNGWTVGAYATLTNVSAARFGEGSFDKGMFFKIPLNWMLGLPTQGSASTLIQPLLRDGGAQLHVDGRLYDVVRAYHANDLNNEWGRVFR